MNRAVFVDRDGTLIAEQNYLADPDAVEFTRGAPEALVRLRLAGFLVVVISNQAGVARGFFGVDTVEAIQQRIDSMLEGRGARVDGWYYCPHHPDFSGPCRCRKPEPGMLLDAMRDLDLDAGSSWMIGDRWTDLEAGGRVGARGILVRTGYGEAEAHSPRPEVAVVAVLPDLLAAAEFILDPARDVRGETA